MEKNKKIEFNGLAKFCFVVLSLNPCVGYLVYVICKESYPDISKIGKVCAIVGLCLWGLSILISIIGFFVSFLALAFM